MCKRLLFYAALLCLFASVAYGAMTYSVKSSPNGDWWSGQTPEFDPAWAWAKEVEDRIEYVTATGAFYFDPTDTAPTASEGMLYYNDTGNTLMLYTGSAWSSLDLAGASSLNTAYGIGAKIDADTTVVEIEVADAANNRALLLDSDENTNNNDVLQITNAGAGIAIDIDGTDGYDIEGTAAAFRVNYTGAVECVGITNTAGDILFDDTYDLSWDTSKDQLLFEDNAVLGLGGAHDGDGDVTVKWDASNLLIESNAEDTGEIRYGSTNAIDVAHYGNTNTSIAKFNANTATLELNGYDLQLQDGDFLMFGDGDDWTIDSSTAKILDVIPGATTDETAALYLGADTAGADLKLFAATSGDYWEWDASAEEWIGIGVDIQLDDDSIARFGTAGDGDVTMQFDGTSFEIFAAAIDTPMLIGGITYGFDLTYYFEGAGQFRSDYDADFINLTDDMELRFGTGASSDGDLKISSNATNVLQIEQVVLDTGTITFGADGRDIPITWYAETAGAEVTITGDLWTFDGVDIIVNDGDFVSFGDSSDFTATSDSTAVFKLASLATDESAIAHIGADQAGIDVRLYGATTAEYLEWDAGNEAIEAVGAQIHLDDTSIMQYGTDKDFTVYSDTANTLEFDPGTTGNTIKFGTSDTDTVVITWYGDVSGDTLTFDEENCELAFIDINIQLDDDADLIFGTNDDWVIESDTAKTLEFIPSGGDETEIFAIGADTAGADFIVYGKTTAKQILFDSSKDSFEVDCSLDIGTLTAFGESDDTPDVSGGSYYVTHATTDTITDFDGTDMVAGQIIVVESAGAITYDVTTTGLKGGSTDLVTADGDLTVWIYNGTDWLLIAFMDLSDDMS